MKEDKNKVTESTTNEVDKKEEPTTIPEEKKPDPTKYGDWQVNGRTIDF